MVQNSGRFLRIRRPSPSWRTSSPEGSAQARWLGQPKDRATAA